jgi:hypothetical protein
MASVRPRLSALKKFAQIELIPRQSHAWMAGVERF